MPAHTTTVAHRPDPRPNVGQYKVTCPCSWGSYGHDSQGAADAAGKQHEAERNR